MKLSTKSRYGVRMLVDMAMHQDQPHCNLADIAKRQDISPRYLEQIAAELKRNSIIKSVRGAHGGYRLGFPAEKLMLKEILDVLEGDLHIVDEQDSYTALQQCLNENVYDPLSRVMQSYLGKISLQDMAEQSRLKDDGEMYYL